MHYSSLTTSMVSDDTRRRLVLAQIVLASERETAIHEIMQAERPKS
jgi:hypothetical protein